LANLKQSGKAILNIMKNATFSCVYKCGETRICMDELMRHTVHKCPERLVECPKGCEQLVKAKAIQEHDAAIHSGLKICPDCEASYLSDN
jgi:hypothetical protein